MNYGYKEFVEKAVKSGQRDDSMEELWRETVIACEDMVRRYGKAVESYVTKSPSTNVVETELDRASFHLDVRMNAFEILAKILEPTQTPA